MTSRYCLMCYFQGICQYSLLNIEVIFMFKRNKNVFFKSMFSKEIYAQYCLTPGRQKIFLVCGIFGQTGLLDRCFCAL